MNWVWLFTGAKVNIMDSASGQEVSSAMKDVLERKGVLSEVRAKLRSEVYKSLDGKNISRPQLCKENLLLNELIRDYLTYNHYMYTQSVLMAESGMPKEPLDRTFLAHELNLREDGDSVPLLYRMLNCFLQDTPTAHTNSAAAQQNQSPSGNTMHAEGTTSGKRTLTFEEPTYHNTC